MQFIPQRPQWQQWSLVSCLIAVLLILGFVSYNAVDRSQHNFEQLSLVEIPLFDDIQKLHKAQTTIESTLYEYYLTTDTQRFEKRYAAQVEIVETILARLYQKIGDAPELPAIVAVQKDIQKTTDQFHLVMTSSSIDWDLARNVLAEFEPLKLRANQESENLSNRMRGRVIENMNTYASDIRKTVYLVSMLTALIVLAVFYLASMNYKVHLLAREQKRLAAFPNSNPNPVLALDPNGNLLFANAVAVMASETEDPMSLLPNDIESRFTQSDVYQEWEYEKDNRHFRINLGWLKDSREYHCFILEITARKKAESRLEYLAYHEPTTGLINRQQFNNFVESLISSPTKEEFVLAIFDLDLLTKVASVGGITVAEKVARLAARRLEHLIKENNVINKSCLSYIGGGLFCICLSVSRGFALDLLDLSKKRLSKTFSVDGFEFILYPAIGMASSSDFSSASPDEALRLADGALNLAKQRGGDQIVAYEAEIESARTRRVQIEKDLRSAIERNEFKLFYQPKISLETGRVAGVEALLRWQKSDGSFVSPAEFIPVAEDSGQILDIGNWVLDQACKDIASWSSSIKDSIKVAVNLSARQLLHGNISASVTKLLKTYNVDNTLLELEITETAALTNFDRALEKLDQLQDAGIQMALDDFGTGYSSLSYLQRLPISTLKIDRAFVKNMTENAKNATITHTMIDMAHQMGLKVVAEGVETKEQLSMLEAWHCEYIQGFLFAKPMPKDELIVFCQGELPVETGSASV